MKLHALILLMIVESETLASLQIQSKEMQLLDKHLKPGIPVLILSMRKVESDPFISTYQVSESLHLKSLNRPWMVSYHVNSQSNSKLLLHNTINITVQDTTSARNMKSWH